MAEWRSGRKVWFNGEQIELLTRQLTAGRKQLAVSVGLSERNIRTCLDKLTKLEITTIKPTNKYSLITILNWDTYQMLNNENDQQTANDRPTGDQRVTTIKEVKNRRIKESGYFKPPTLEETTQYFEQELKGTKVQAINFFQFYGAKDWFVGKNKMKNWHLAAARSMSWSENGGQNVKPKRAVGQGIASA